MMNKPNPQNRTPNKTINDLIAFLENTSESFTESSPFKTQYHKDSDEDHLTEILLWHYQEKNKQNKEKYIFMAQPKQKGRRKVDIGIGLYGGNGYYIFCIEAKNLPSTEYITGDKGAIKRFKKCEHGLNSSNSINGIPLPQNGIVAYVKSGTFEKYFDTINEQIQKRANQYTQISDEFDLLWQHDEQLEKIYFKQIARLRSKHPRQKASEVILHHFWIDVSQT